MLFASSHVASLAFSKTVILTGNGGGRTGMGTVPQGDIWNVWRHCGLSHLQAGGPTGIQWVEASVATWCPPTHRSTPVSVSSPEVKKWLDDCCEGHCGRSGLLTGIHLSFIKCFFGRLKHIKRWRVCFHMPVTQPEQLRTPDQSCVLLPLPKTCILD